jgi:hypothetical protein
MSVGQMDFDQKTVSSSFFLLQGKLERLLCVKYFQPSLIYLHEAYATLGGAPYSGQLYEWPNSHTRKFRICPKIIVECEHSSFSQLEYLYTSRNFSKFLDLKIRSAAETPTNAGSSQKLLKKANTLSSYSSAWEFVYLPTNVRSSQKLLENANTLALAQLEFVCFKNS